jgi:RNA polymerase sigma factor (sigma-70 family)
VTATDRDPRAVLDAVWRLESARIVASVARLVRDVGLAEELAQDAVVAALDEWPRMGIPDRPGAWLLVAARHRAIDRLRRDDRLERNVQLLGEDAHRRQADHGTESYDEVVDADGVRDAVLRLVFVACHPALPEESRVALTLRVVGGLTTEEIARAFLAPEATIAQRIVRAKRTLADLAVPFELPPAAEREARLTSVLEVVYLIFNEGYSATVGDDWLRADLCADGLRLGRVLAELAPTEPEVHGLVALMELQSSRLRARLAPDGAPVPLLEQHRGRWDQLLIRRGFAALLRAERLRRPAGPYVLQAAIAACHAHARTAAETDWPRIVGLYDNLLRLTPTPVVQLNRAVAVAMAYGPQEAWAIVERLAAEPALRAYHPLPAVRADLLARLGRPREAAAEYLRAAELTRNARERQVLHQRATALRTTQPGPRRDTKDT